jgi:peptide chain release factor 1
VVVSVLSRGGDTIPVLREADIKVDITRGSGPGGQHKNKTYSYVRARHIPTGIVATADGRSQGQNRKKALEELSRRVYAQQKSKSHVERNQSRRSQSEGDRAFTWTAWGDQVTNHRTGQKAKMSKVLKGRLDLIV